MSHDHSHGGEGHNHDGAWHLQSHLEDADKAADLHVISRQFIDGFREAKDKAAYLRIAGVPTNTAARP